MSESFLSMLTFVSCLSSVLHPTNYVNYKQMLISTLAFGNNEFRFRQDNFSYPLAVQLAFCSYQSCSGHSNKQLTAEQHNRGLHSCYCAS